MNDNREPVFWPWFILLVGCCGAVGYFLVHGDYITAFALIVFVLSSLSGYCVTASRLLCWYAGLAASAVLTSKLILFGRSTLTEWLGTSGFVLSVIVTGVVAALATAVTLRRLIVRYCPAPRSLEALNRWSGLALGAVQGALLCGLVLGGLLVLEPIAKHRLLYDVEARDSKIPQVLSTKVVLYARQTSRSAIGPTVARYNPFHLLPPLEELRQDLLGLGNPLTRTPSQSEQAIREHLSAR